MINKNTNFKRLFSLTMVTVVTAALLVGCGGDAKAPAAADNGGSSFKDRTLKFGHVRPEGSSTDEDSKAFMNYITENTDGMTKFEVYPNSQLGDYSLVQERIGIGDVDMQLAPASPNVNPAITITSVPYLVSSWEDAKVVFARDGAVYNEIGEMFEQENIKMLASYPKYFGSIILTKEPKSPGDPNVAKGIKIRVPGMKAFELAADALGFQASPIAFSEAFTSIQTGIVDGAIGSGAEGYYASFRDVTKYYLPVNSHFEIWWIQMSMDVWNGMSAEEQAVVQAAAQKFEEDRWMTAPDEEQKYIDLLKEAGATVIEYTDDELNAMADKVRTEVWPNIKNEYGAELFDQLTKR